MNLNGTGILTLGGANPYSGGMVVSNGTLLVNGSLASPVTVASAGTLGGSGALNGAVTVSGTLAPGINAIGKLTVNNTLTLAGSTVMKLSRTGALLTNDLVVVSGTLTRGGTLTVTNLGSSALQAGDSFTLFTAGTFSGAFASLSLPALGTGLFWNTNNLAVNGTLSVAYPSSTLAYLADPNGTINGSTPQPVNYAASGSAVTAVPNPGYHLFCDLV